MIPEIQGFQYNGQIMGLQDITCASEGIDHIGCLVIHVLSQIHKSGNHGHPSGIDSFSNLNRLLDL